MRVLIVDDHPLMADALRLTVLALDQAAQVEIADSVQVAKAKLAQPTLPDLLLLDLSLPDSNGENVLTTLRAQHPMLPVVVVSGESDKQTILRCLDAGAMGFIPKTSSRDVLLNAIRLVLSGGIYVPAEALAQYSANLLPTTNVPRDSKALFSRLSVRQGDVLKLLLKGLPNKLIGRELDITENTVKIHVSAVLKELGASNRTHALLVAHQIGLKL
jgi:DNA-binding NarL/FixJ family response regulator